MRIVSGSPDDTRSFGAALAGVLRPGDVVLLVGELGAGKTTLVGGIGRALGITEPMTSPTFTLMRTYEGDRLVAHVDAWRLENLREVLDLGLEELLDQGAIALVEWGDAVAPLLGTDAIVVRIEAGSSDAERTIEVDSEGPAADRLAALQADWRPSGGRV